VRGREGVGGRGTKGGVNFGEEGCEGAVETVGTGTERGVVTVGEVMVADYGVVDEGLEDGRDVTCISQVLDPAQSGDYQLDGLWIMYFCMFAQGRIVLKTAKLDHSPEY
jgi:hypothetical protein